PWRPERQTSQRLRTQGQGPLYRARPIHHRSDPHQSSARSPRRPPQAGDLLVRYLLHPHLLARSLLVLPARDQARPARPRRPMKPFLLLLPLMAQAANYSVRKTNIDGVDVVLLADAARKTEVAIAPSIGNMAYELKVNGKNAFWFPFHSAAELREKPTLCGNPFLAPWANRIDQDAFYANGRKYLLNPDAGNLRRDQHQKPIHGVLNFSPAWKLVSADANTASAHATS